MTQAKKSYGQHFLNRVEIAQKIADSLKDSTRVPRVLEVGPGLGMLTQYLLGKGNELVVVEADKDMVSILEKKFPPLSMRIISEDFLKVNVAQVFDNQEFSLIGNFPYNISSQIVIKMLENRELIPEMVGMFQLEVAERIITKEGSKDYGVLSVLCQAFYEGKKLFNVDKSCFSPPPKVQSAVIRLQRKANQDLGCDPILFKKVVKQAFSQRRKMMRNTLKPFFTKDPSVLEDTFFNLRPEQLSVEAFVTLTNRVAEQLPQ